MSVPSSQHDPCHTARIALHRSVIHALHNLQVEQVGEHLIISGQVESYYHKQMAQEIIRAEMPAARLINSVIVH